MSEPDYKDDLVFEPSSASMPRCDIEDLQNKLNIVVEILKRYAEEDNWKDCETFHEYNGVGRIKTKGYFSRYGFLLAQDALKEIGVVK